MSVNSTQDHIPVKEIRDDLVILKNNDVSLVLQTSAVNFGLLSQNEQIAIISAFAGLLNSLSFSIQLVIRSKRLNIASYLQLLDDARSKQTNPLLSQMMLRYRNFIDQTIKENEVLDKKFYVVIGLGALELGLGRDADDRMKKATTILKPRRDHIIRQLAGIGLQAKQLTTTELIVLFYDLYNGIVTDNPNTDLTHPPTVEPPHPPVHHQQPAVATHPSAPVEQTPMQPAPQAKKNEESVNESAPLFSDIPDKPEVPTVAPQVIVSAPEETAGSESGHTIHFQNPFKYHEDEQPKRPNELFITEEVPDEYRPS